MEVLFISAFAMSLAFAAQPGVIGFESLRRGLTHGWSAALHVELGSLVGDGVWAIIALVGASVLFQNRVLTIILGLVGCALLLRFAWDAWLASRSDILCRGLATTARITWRRARCSRCRIPRTLHSGWV